MTVEQQVLAVVVGIVIFSLGFITGCWWHSRPEDPEDDPDTTGWMLDPRPATEGVEQ